jgi:membrane-associated phospholipid phosphatase
LTPKYAIIKEKRRGNMHYERLMRHVAKRLKLVKVLKVYCHLASALAVAAFALLFRFYLNISLVSAVKYLCVLGVPFVLVSLLRRYIGAPRPYEVYDFFECRPKDSEKNSFPSRHAFSIFAIGVATWFVYPVFGSILLTLGLLMCVSRVALGYHFPRDVIAGSIIGVFSSVIGFLFLI